MPTVIFSDESGTHNNRYMIITAVITRTPKARKRIKNLMSRKLVEYRRPGMTDEVHASALTIPERQDIHTLLAKRQDYQVAYLVADKNHLKRELKDRPNLCYNYLFSILAKRVLATIDDDIDIIGDNRDVAAGSVNSLPEYVQTEAYAKWNYTHNLNVCFRDSCTVRGLQAADLIANAIYAKYEMGKSHLYGLHQQHFTQKIHFPYQKFGS